MINDNLFLYSPRTPTGPVSNTSDLCQRFPPTTTNLLQRFPSYHSPVESLFEGHDSPTRPDPSTPGAHPVRS